MSKICECGAVLGRRNTSGYCTKCKGGLNRIPIPADFAARAGDMSNAEVQAEWGVSDGTVTNWRKITGVKAPYRPRPPGNMVETPPEFAELAKTHNIKQLSERLGISKPTVRRILFELNIKAAQPERKPKKQNKLHVMANMGKVKVAAAMAAPQNRDMSLPGRAADFLQKRSAIWRCDAQGRFKLGGSHWKWKGEARTAEYIIAEAKHFGFDPDAWKELAA